jgi:hypothetical protein
VPALTVSGIAAFIAFGTDRSGSAPNSATTPAPVRAAAMLELFACLRDGPGTCGEFDVTVDFLDRISDGAFTYTPLRPGDPGEPVAGDQRRVKLAHLSTVQARAIGAAVARFDPAPGAAGMTAVRVDPQLETVAFVESDLRGTVAFALDAGTYRLLSVTYRPEHER